VLNNCLALDLTDRNGFLCGKMLADLGVEVIKVEPPGGDSSRMVGPYYKDIIDPEKSLYWMAYNSNKKSITLDFQKPAGRELFKRLVEKSDFILESYAPGYLDGIELGFLELRKIKPNIILTSISPFGQSGPYRDFLAVDLISMAMSGILYQTGDQDKRPVHMSLPQACLHAGADAALGTLMAYHYREQSGEGQWVDVSLQQSAAWFLANAVPIWEMNHIVAKRSGSFRWSMQSSQRQVWPCRDGYVFFNIIGGRTGAKTLHELVAWMESEGFYDEYLHQMDWETLDMFAVDQSEVDRISRPIEIFFGAHTKKEIFEGAAQKRISVCPLSSMQDLHNDKQLASRGFWTSLDYPEWQTSITQPNRYFTSSEVNYSLRNRAPAIGEHNDSFYSRLGLSPAELADLKQNKVI
jgi:crotonobetainyl-CoA:carnitine CoA-transferase CaiB-like acyl-CoA transferase